MTTDDILRMAREAGLLIPTYRDHVTHLERFAALVAAAEREECAKVAERATARKRTIHKVANNLPELPPCAIADAIRARGKQ